MNRIGKNYLIPFSLTCIIIILDQISKAYIVANWPIQGTLIKDIFNNEFLILCHVRNKAIAFSLGENIPDQFRYLLFVIIPIAVLVFLTFYYFTTTDFSQFQRWNIAGIIGGGIGNIIDRIARSEGVVDFISVKFYGILGLERWPTFNLADSTVVICCCLLFLSMLKPVKRSQNE